MNNLKYRFENMGRIILRFQTSRPVLTLACALILAGLAIVYTAVRLEFKTSQRALISTDNRLMQLLDFAELFSEPDGFIVAVENKNVHRSLEFVNTLTSCLQRDTEHFAEVFSRVDPRLFRPWALLYLTPREINELHDNLAAHEPFLKKLSRSPGLVTIFDEISREMRSTMVEHLFTGFLDSSSAEGKTGALNLDFVAAIMREMKKNLEGSSTFNSPWRSFFKEGTGNQAEEGYFWTEGKKYVLIFVAPNLKKTGGPSQEEALVSLRRNLRSMKELFPDVEAGVTGQKALDEDEKYLASKDIGVATLVSLAGLAVLLLLFWRTVRRPMLQLTTQAVGLSLTFGLTTLFIGHLNLLSITFAPMVLGLGMDYDIHWFSRYNEERLQPGRTTGEALAVTMESMGPTILLASLSTSLAFLPLTITGFKGLAELGVICAIGLFVSSVTTLCLLPALIMLFDKPPARGAPRFPTPAEARPMLRTTKKKAFVILALTVAGAGFSAWGAGKIKFDLNMLHLQSKTAESVIWETKLIKDSKYPSIYGVLFAHSLTEVARKTETLKKLDTVSNVRSVRDFLPPDQVRTIPLVRRMKPILSGIPNLTASEGPIDAEGLNKGLSRIRFIMDEGLGREGDLTGRLEAQMKEVRSLIDGITHDLKTIETRLVIHRLKKFELKLLNDMNEKLSLIRENTHARPMEVSDLPGPVLKRFVGPDDIFLMRVFPSSDIWDPRFLGTFVRDLRIIDPDATGDPVTLYVFTREFRDASIKSAIYALVLIFLFLALTLRSTIFALAAISPLVLGALLTFGLMHIFGVDLNLANTIFLPLVIGAGVEYGVIIIGRWQQKKSGQEQAPLPFSTGMGIILAGLSTTVGFGSLMISRHQGIYSLGLLTTVGSVVVLAVAILFLPALLSFMPPRPKGDSKIIKDRDLNPDHREEL